MLHSKYSTYDRETGEFIEIYELEDLLNAIRDINEENKKEIKKAHEKNKELLDEHYRDEKIQYLNEKLRKMEADYYRGFPISEEECEAIKNWTKKHDEEEHGYDTLNKKIKAGGVIGGRYSYHFTPTSIGTSGIVRCSCGAEFEFHEIG